MLDNFQQSNTNNCKCANIKDHIILCTDIQRRYAALSLAENAEITFDFKNA